MTRSTRSRGITLFLAYAVMHGSVQHTAQTFGILHVTICTDVDETQGLPAFGDTFGIKQHAKNDIKFLTLRVVAFNSDRS